MAQELKSRVAIVGGGPAGCICAYFLQNDFDVTVFDFSSPLRTLLPTGGGRCNLCHAEYDFKELAKNYPRGEKFLYSVFSKFSTADTIEFFEKIGVKTYIQDDMRIFPESNSAKDVREKFLKALNKVKFVKEKVLRINPPYLQELSPLTRHSVTPSPTIGARDKMQVVTDMGAHKTDYVVISTGGHASYELIKLSGHKIIEPKPALTGLVTREDFSSISGVSINDILFTHKGVSGPAVYKISSLKARDKFPYNLSFNFVGDIDLQSALNENPHKSIKNLLTTIPFIRPSDTFSHAGEKDTIPKSFAEFVLKNLKINPDEKCHRIDGKTRDRILDKLQNFTVTAVGTVPDGEVVTAGGVDLNEINPKTMESKLHKGIYFCGEVMDIDGFCGGFNLQNCWSTGYVAATGIIFSNQ